MTVGQELMMLNQQNKPMPDLIKDEAGDSDKVKAVKAMIRQMTLFDPKKRLTMAEVEQKLTAVNGGTAYLKVFVALGKI